MKLGISDDCQVTLEKVMEEGYNFFYGNTSFILRFHS